MAKKQEKSIEQNSPDIYAIFVPSTRLGNVTISKNEYKVRTMEVVEFLTKHFGGCNVITSYGFWDSGEEIIQESTNIAWALNLDDSAPTKQAFLAYAKTLRDKWHQVCVLAIIANTPYLV